jgi:phenylalanyl-tRNA synthetase beta chain
MVRKEHGTAGTAAPATATEEVIYRIDIPANRYDMLCLEGIARALNIFRGVATPPTYALSNPAGGLQQVTVMKETALIRPFLVAAVLRGVAFNTSNYDSFINLQDRLHQNLCRQRSLVAIGTHDLDTIKVLLPFDESPG